MSNPNHDPKTGEFTTGQGGSGSMTDSHVRSRQSMGTAKGGSEKAFNAALKGTAEAAATSQVSSRALRNDPKLLREFNTLVKSPLFMGSSVKSGVHSDSDLRHKISRMKSEIEGQFK